jgi:hypothetical protein
MLFVVLALGIFLLGVMAFAVDMGWLWFHRQSAQTVADAACTAGAMDMLTIATGSNTTANAGFTPGTAFSCSGSPNFSSNALPNAAPCKYAAQNGYTTSKLVAGQAGADLGFSFPPSVPGLPACKTGKGAPAVCNASSFTGNPFLQVNVDDRAQTFFAGLLSGSGTVDVGAQATCAVVFSNAPIPLLVLNPTLQGSLLLNGTGSRNKITIAGGPQRSIQVDSSDPNAITAKGGPTVDLSQGGPNNTGSDVGVTGGPGSAPFTFLGGSTGNYLDPRPAISDPFALLPVPSKLAAGTKTTGVTTNGCPAGTSGGCDEYTAGYYAGIQVKNGTAIFDPGLYYLDGNLDLQSNSCVRPSTLVGDGSGGTVFYFNTGTVSVVANSGSNCATSISTTTGTGTGQLQFGVKCTSASQAPASLPATITGNLLLGACTGSYGDPLLTDDPIGEQHGILFFQNRSTSAAAPSWGGNGSAAAVGSMYFHYCNSPDGAGLGSNCPSSAFTDLLTLQGTPGSTSYVVGDIVADQLTVSGNASVVMELNPNALFYVLKASLIQ